MRRLLLLALVAACHSSATGPQPTGTLIYHLSPLCMGGTPARGGIFQFVLDGRAIGTATLPPDGQWATTGVEAGDHLASAVEVNPDFPQLALRTWAPEPVTIRPDGIVMKLLAC